MVLIDIKTWKRDREKLLEKKADLGKRRRAFWWGVFWAMGGLIAGVSGGLVFSAALFVFMLRYRGASDLVDAASDLLMALVPIFPLVFWFFLNRAERFRVFNEAVKMIILVVYASFSWWGAALIWRLFFSPPR